MKRFIAALIFGASSLLSGQGVVMIGGSGFTLTTTGTSGPATYTGGVLNIPQYSGGGSMTWPSGGAGIPNYTGSSAWGTSYSASNPIPANFMSNITLANVTAGAATSGTYNFSGATQLIEPVAAGYASAANGEMGYDTTNLNWHGWQNGADLLLAFMPKSGLTSGHCVQFLASTNSWTLADAGAACGSGGAVSSVTNSDGTLTISPTTGAVVASLALSHANTWTGNQTAAKWIASTGFDISGATTSGHYLRNNGTDYVDSAIQAGDVPTLNQNTTGTAAGLSGSQTANYFYAAPNGSSGSGAWRAIVLADLPSALFTLTTTGTSGPATYSGGTLNIPQYSGSSGISGGTSGYLAVFGSASTITSGIAVGNSGSNIPQLSSGLLNNSVVNWASPPSTGYGSSTPEPVAATTITATTSVSVGSSPPTCGTGATGCVVAAEASTAGTPATGVDYCRADSTTHLWKCSTNGGSEYSMTQTICSGQVALTASGNAIASGAYYGASSSTPQTITCTGAATTDTVQMDFASDPTGVTGFGPSSTGVLITIVKYVTSNTINVKAENNTASSITPGTISLNYRVTR